MILDKFAWQWGGLKSQINHIYSILNILKQQIH